MMQACCCRGLTRYGCSGQGERAAAARGGQRSTGPFPAQGARAWAAEPSPPWGTRAEKERRDHSPQPSSLCRSFWTWGNVLKVEIVYCVSFILQLEAVRNGIALQGHLCHWVRFLNREEDHTVKSGVNRLKSKTVFPTSHRAKEIVPAEITLGKSVVQINKLSGEPSSKLRHAQWGLIRFNLLMFTCPALFLPRRPTCSQEKLTIQELRSLLQLQTICTVRLSIF